jgi:hypothetical protein
MWSFKHFSSHRRPERQMQEFRDVLEYCDMHDLGFTGVPWTFDNKQKGDRNVKVWLDRAATSSTWWDWFKDALVNHLVTSRSDHLPIFLDMAHDRNQNGQKRMSRYEIMWDREESLPEEFRCAWETGTLAQNLGEFRCAWETGTLAQNLGDFAGKLKGVMSALKLWCREKFSVVTSELEKFRKRLEELSEKDPREVDEEVGKPHQ